jgi:hypothetical protein
MSGGPAATERILRKSIATDPNRPRALTLLALAITAQIKPSDVEMQAVVDEISSPNWADAITVTTSDVRSECQSVIQSFTN